SQFAETLFYHGADFDHPAVDHVAGAVVSLQDTLGDRVALCEVAGEAGVAALSRGGGEVGVRGDAVCGGGGVGGGESVPAGMVHDECDRAQSFRIFRGTTGSHTAGEDGLWVGEEVPPGAAGQAEGGCPAGR